MREGDGIDAFHPVVAPMTQDLDRFEKLQLHLEIIGQGIYRPVKIGEEDLMDLVLICEEARTSSSSLGDINHEVEVEFCPSPDGGGANPVLKVL